jgi:hypothetical protein
LKAFGVLQRVEMPKEEAAKQALQRVNDEQPYIYQYWFEIQK